MNLADAQSMLALYEQAEMAVLKGQAHSFNGRSVTMANLSEIRQGRKEWEKRVRVLSGYSRVRTAVMEPRA